MKTKTTRNANPDVRHAPFIDFASTTYRQERGETLIIDGRSVSAVAAMLKATRAHIDEFSVDALERYWVYFLQHANDFDRSQPPLVWFARNLNRWSAECKGNKKVAAGLSAARTWMDGRLKK